MFICSVLGTNSDVCAFLNAQPAYSASPADFFNTQEVSVKSMVHQLQNTITDRYQDYQIFFPLGMMENTLTDLSTIDSVPVRYVWMQDDDLCLPSVQKATTDLIPTNDGSVELSGSNGRPTSDNEAEFLGALRSLLVNQGEQLTLTDCLSDFAWN